MKKKLLKKDIKEIEKAIKRFDLIASGCLPITDNIGGSECGLCTMYNKNPGCYGCPISAKTGHPHCTYTPYSGISSYFPFFEEYIQEGYTKNPGMLKICMESLEYEIEFLISLLPDNHKLRE